jgi:hypothetical protein
MLNGLDITGANPLLSNFTPEVETNVFQQSILTQSYEDEYKVFQQIEGFVDSTFDSDSWVSNRYGACVGGAKSNSVKLILRLFLYHILHMMSL